MSTPVTGAGSAPWMTVPSSLNAPAAKTTPAPSSNTPPGGAMGKDQFLQLLVTQLRNQDPMNPSDPSAMASQLAQFSQLEQLVNLNQTLGNQQASFANMTSSTAVNTLGKLVLARGNQVEVGDTGVGQVGFAFGSPAANATLHVFDASGHEVVTQQLGQQGSGPAAASFQLPGGLPAGAYTFSVDGTDASGAALTATTYEKGVVDGIQYTTDGPVLLAGALQMKLSDVVEITTPN